MNIPILKSNDSGKGVDVLFYWLDLLELKEGRRIKKITYSILKILSVYTRNTLDLSHSYRFDSVTFSGS